MYISEAHSADKWSIGIPGAINEPTNLEERKDAAQVFVDKLGWTLPMFIDRMDNKFRDVYAAWPTRFYVIHQGKIKYISEPLDSHFHLGALVEVLNAIVKK